MNKNIQNSQNFLHSNKLVENILAKSNIDLDDIVIEIGPGKGIITKALAEKCREVKAVELDCKLANNLKLKFNSVSNISIIEMNFLDFKLPINPYKVFANIPFNMTAEIVQKLLESSAPLVDAYLIMQYEAALKYAGMPYYSDCFRSLMYKPLWEIEIIHEFQATDFTPIPEAKIVLVHFHRKQFCDIKNATMKEYWDFLSYVFSANGQSVKEKVKLIFTYEQQKRLRKSVKIDFADSISKISYPQWLELFNCYNSFVCDSKKNLIINSYDKLLRSQKRLDKVHKNRLYRQRKK